MPIDGRRIVKNTAEVCVMNVLVYQGKELNVFASAEAAQKWFEENDPEGVAFMCEVEGEEQLERESRASRRGAKEFGTQNRTSDRRSQTTPTIRVCEGRPFPHE